jgi:N-methylhydantoinase A
MTEQPSVPHFRIGIDVGGTFTDVVAVDARTFTLVDQLKVPTTHDATDGVAGGIIDALDGMLARLGVSADQVVFIAHSTTQATNALLEGDVARVGIVGAGSGLESWKARIDTRVPPVTLAPGRVLHPAHRFVRVDRGSSDQVRAAVAEAVRALETEGVAAIVASEAFGVDDPAIERAIVEAAGARGLLATAGHDVSTLYGLRTRTRTAAINAAILPKMVETAALTDTCVRRTGITAPLMIMRSDGGVMSVAEVHRRPIQTMLSGPAAGIAGALMHERVSDGIFIEVGGTSADISVIRDGQPQMRPARVGGHRTFLTTLDVRTLAIAGGSMVRAAEARLLDVGPRSAHIAGLAYACFAAGGTFGKHARIAHVRPRPDDPSDYVAVLDAAGVRHALTPTCAANALGVVPDDAFARADQAHALSAFEPLGRLLSCDATSAARQVLDMACEKVRQQVDQLIDEYRLERSSVDLVGGGGGAAALVPHTGQTMRLTWRLARQAEVISPIGVALAMVRDTVERHVVDPTPADVLRVRQEAVEAAVRAGAMAEGVEVQVEVDRQRNLVRATAVGTAELRRRDRQTDVVDEAARREAAARSMRVPVDLVEPVASTGSLDVFEAVHREPRAFGFWSRVRSVLRVVDASGIVRLQRRDTVVRQTTVDQCEVTLRAVLGDLSEYGDAGREIPDVHVLAGARIISLAGLADEGQVLGLAGAELRGRAADDPVVVIATRRTS